MGNGFRIAKKAPKRKLEVAVVRAQALANQGAGMVMILLKERDAMEVLVNNLIDLIDTNHPDYGEILDITGEIEKARESKLILDDYREVK